MDAPRDPFDSPALQRRAWPVRRQWTFVTASALIVLGILIVVYFTSLLFGGRHDASAEPVSVVPGSFKPTARQLRTFTVETVATHAFASQELTDGKIAFNGDRSTPVISPYSGKVLRVNASLGDRVHAGAELATLEASEFVQAQNDLRVAATQLKLARTSATRKAALLEAKGGSLQDVQQAQADLSAASTALTAARSRLRILGRSDADIARLERTPTIELNATLSAPIGGVIVDRQIGPGQYLQAGGPALFTIADPASVWLVANVRESDAGAVRPGQQVDVHVLAYPQRSFTARIAYVAAMLDPSTHRLPVRAEIDNHDGALKPDMFASFRIRTSESSDAAAVPLSAVIYEGDAAHVWVLDATDRLDFRAVKAGRDDGGLLEITDGLRAGERVVTRGGLFIDQAATPAAT